MRLVKKVVFTTYLMVIGVVLIFVATHPKVSSDDLGPTTAEMEAMLNPNPPLKIPADEAKTSKEAGP